MRVMYQKRWSHGFQSMVQYAHMWGRQQWLPNQFDPEPSWQINSNIRPNRLVWSNVVELPFGKSHQWLQHGPLSYVVGGWQASWIYTYQTGAMISWGNQFYSGPRRRHPLEEPAHVVRPGGGVDQFGRAAFELRGP
jgi:hypothetical protein